MSSALPSFVVGLGCSLVVALTACSGGSSAPVSDPPAGAATEPGSSGNPSGPGTSTPPSGSADAGPPATSSGCSAPAAAAGLSEKTIAAGGAQRRYQVFVPPGYDAKTPLRLVYVFHGLGGDGDQIRAYFSFEQQAAGKAIFVYPEGVAQAAVGGATGWGFDDLAFFDAMAEAIPKAYCVDSKRVFAAGHSFGGYMSNLVGCSRGDVVRAIAPVSGGMVTPGDCKGPVAAWIAHGDKDGTVATSEGIAARDRWLGVNKCGSTTKPTTPSPCVMYDGCEAGRPVTWCQFSGGHFPLPSFTRQAIWDFFAAF